MSDVTFRTSTPQITTTTKSNIPEPVTDKTHTETDYEDLEPMEGNVAILQALDIDDQARNLPEADRSNLAEVTGYIDDILKAKGLSKTAKSYKGQLDSLMEEMGLDKGTEPQMILDRIGGVIKAWKSIVFIKDPKKRKSLFMKLAKEPDSKAMDKLVFKTMEDYRIWE